MNYCRAPIVFHFGLQTARPGPKLDPGAGALVWFSQRLGVLHGAAGMLPEGPEKQVPIGLTEPDGAEGDDDGTIHIEHQTHAGGARPETGREVKCMIAACIMPKNTC